MLMSNGLYFALSTISSILLEKLRLEVLQNSELQSLVQDCEVGIATNYTFRDGLLFYKDKLRIASDSDLKMVILKEFHSTPIGGHAGILKTFMRIYPNFYWPGLREDVKQYVKNCYICQQIKYPTTKSAGLLQPLPIPDDVWEDVSMDFITGLPKSKGVTIILVVVDRLSKSAHFGTLPTTFTAVVVANLFIDIVVKLHGFPLSIVSDRDPIFLSHFWKALFHLSGTSLKYSTAYHPQTDGQTEVMNRCLEQYLRAFSHQHPKDWTKFLVWAELWYNTSFHTSTGMTPFEALYGKPPKNI